MNKKIKLLTPILCGALLSSSLVFTNVQASTPAKNDVKQETNIKSIIPVNQKYSFYCQLPSKALSQIERYVSNNEKPTADGIRNILIQNGISRIAANNISFSLLDLSVKSHGGSSSYDVFPESAFRGDIGRDDLILSDGNGRFSLAEGVPATGNYSIYGILSNKDLSTLYRNMKNDPFTDGNIYDYAERMIIKSDITDDKVMAKKIARLFYNFVVNTDYFFPQCIGLNENFLIMVSDDNEKVIITREAR